jgi:hypothetical protein
MPLYHFVTSDLPSNTKAPELDGSRPRHVVNLRDIVSVELERTKELVKAQTRVSGNTLLSPLTDEY